MKQTRTAFPQQQKGAAAIMFALMLPVLVGLMFLSIEGGRYLRLKAEVADAAEVATLAVTAQGSEDQGKRVDLAKKYMDALVHDKSSIGSVKVDRQYCSKTQCSDKRQYTDGESLQFKVDVTTHHTSWFPKSKANPFGFEPEVQFTPSQTARKNQSTAVDVVLVANFSNTMNERWPAGQGKKIDVVRSIVNGVADKLTDYAKLNGGKRQNTLSLVPFNQVTKDRWRDRWRWRYCSVSQRVYRKNDPENFGPHMETYRRMFDKKGCFNSNFTNRDGHKGAVGHFWTVKAGTDGTDYELIKREMKSMRPDGTAASFEGIIRGAQLAKIERNPRRLIIVLSDGKEHGVLPIRVKRGNKYYYYYKNDNVFSSDYIHTYLINNPTKYCDKIRTELNKPNSPGGQKFQSKIVGIGIGYDPTDGRPNLAHCVGKDNMYMYHAKDGNEILDGILGLIMEEEIGHLHTPTT